MSNPFGIEDYVEFTDDRLHGEIRELGDYLAYIRKDVLKFKSQKKLLEVLELERDRTWIRSRHCRRQECPAPEKPPQSYNPSISPPWGSSTNAESCGWK